MAPTWLQHGREPTRIRGGQEEVYVGYVENWNIPIGKDDTQEWPIWVFYREWLYRRKKWLNNLVENQKNGESWTNRVEKNRNRDLINDSGSVFQGKSI